MDARVGYPVPTWSRRTRWPHCQHAPCSQGGSLSAANHAPRPSQASRSNRDDVSSHPPGRQQILPFPELPRCPLSQRSWRRQQLPLPHQIAPACASASSPISKSRLAKPSQLPPEREMQVVPRAHLDQSPLRTQSRYSSWSLGSATTNHHAQDHHMWGRHQTDRNAFHRYYCDAAVGEPAIPQ
eukprot:scaffold124572_cov27-Tisochrysis_lutea.AAC.3